MTLQWTAVAFFLYAEITVVLIFCVPFISAQRWRLVFSWRIWNWLSPYWNKGFFAMIAALVVLFLDAIREVNKYSGPEPMQEVKVNPNLYDHVHMKLFRAQRNLYICGFSLFLWLILRRVVTLLNQLAVSLESNAGLQTQMDTALHTANQHKEDNQMLKKALLEGEKSMSATKQQLHAELQAAEEAVKKANADMEAMRRQAKGLAQEYDRLLTEHRQLQNLQSSEDKKDQ